MMRESNFMPLICIFLCWFYSDRMAEWLARAGKLRLRPRDRRTRNASESSNISLASSATLFECIPAPYLAQLSLQRHNIQNCAKIYLTRRDSLPFMGPRPTSFRSLRSWRAEGWSVWPPPGRAAHPTKRSAQRCPSSVFFRRIRSSAAPDVLFRNANSGITYPSADPVRIGLLRILTK